MGSEMGTYALVSGLAHPIGGPYPKAWPGRGAQHWPLKCVLGACEVLARVNERMNKEALVMGWSPVGFGHPLVVPVQRGEQSGGWRNYPGGIQ